MRKQHFIDDRCVAGMTASFCDFNPRPPALVGVERWHVRRITNKHTLQKFCNSIILQILLKKTGNDQLLDFPRLCYAPTGAGA